MYHVKLNEIHDSRQEKGTYHAITPCSAFRPSRQLFYWFTITPWKKDHLRHHANRSLNSSLNTWRLNKLYDLSSVNFSYKFSNDRQGKKSVRRKYENVNILITKRAFLGKIKKIFKFFKVFVLVKYMEIESTSIITVTFSTLL